MGSSAEIVAAPASNLRFIPSLRGDGLDGDPAPSWSAMPKLLWLARPDSTRRAPTGTSKATLRLPGGSRGRGRHDGFLEQVAQVGGGPRLPQQRAGLEDLLDRPQ